MPNLDMASWVPTWKGLDVHVFLFVSSAKLTLSGHVYLSTMQYGRYHLSIL